MRISNGHTAYRHYCRKIIQLQYRIYVPDTCIYYYMYPVVQRLRDPGEVNGPRFKTRIVFTYLEPSVNGLGMNEVIWQCFRPLDIHSCWWLLAPRTCHSGLPRRDPNPGRGPARYCHRDAPAASPPRTAAAAPTRRLIRLGIKVVLLIDVPAGNATAKGGVCIVGLALERTASVSEKGSVTAGTGRGSSSVRTLARPHRTSDGKGLARLQRRHRGPDP